MSEATKNLIEIYDDIDLCYKVMGLTFSDPPDRVDRVYNGLVAEYTNNMQSTDPALRNEAKANLEQTKELYERITSSMIYKDYAREYEKYKQLKQAELEEKRLKAEAGRASMVPCPSCGKMLSASTNICIYCNHRVPTAVEQKLKGMFSGIFKR
jgi:hypothetical protein